ncbi:hypothetical protein M5689_001749 [Euphorbia peplus]|nr:hypothetical protein M5689_001749 [Euphorbia peplus]
MGDTNVAKQEKWIQHYSSFHKILLVGEGDFSFTVSLATAFGSASNIVATSLDYKDQVKKKYSKGEMNLNVLKEMGCTIIHGVDAHNMSYHRGLVRRGPFDRIVFNFPHAPLLYREDNFIQIELHQELVRDFLWNACEMVAIKGQVHVTQKTAYPFSEWRIKKLGKEAELRLIGKSGFYIRDYPGYQNKRGYERGNMSCDDSFPIGECCTFRFVL